MQARHADARRPPYPSGRRSNRLGDAEHDRAGLGYWRPVPFYEYRRADGTTFEVMQRMSDPQLTEDPETGQPVERVFHPIAVHFKGKGFYNTDYGTRSRERETAAQKGDKGDGGSTGDAKPSSGDSSAKPSGSSEPTSGSTASSD